MRTLILVTPLLLPGATLRQQAPAPQAETSAVEKKLAALVDRFQKQDQAVLKAYEQAKSDEEKTKLLATRPGKEYAPEFRALAEEAKGTDTAVKAWLWVLRLDGRDPKQAKGIIDHLLSEYVQSPALGELVGSLPENGPTVLGRSATADALRGIVADSPHERVRAGALFALGQMLLESGKPEDKAEGRDCMTAVVTEYGETSNGETTYGKLAERTMYELEHLQLGMVAPDFEASDENGAQWKLSDYRGKVVVVDFWGFW